MTTAAKKSLRTRLMLFLSVVGPGFITANVDNDAGGRHAEERASEAYACEGRRIVTRRPERPDEDWNDVLMRRVRAAA